jgi:hypothetical protein
MPWKKQYEFSLLNNSSGGGLTSKIVQPAEYPLLRAWAQDKLPSIRAPLIPLAPGAKPNYGRRFKVDIGIVVSGNHVRNFHPHE